MKKSELKALIKEAIEEIALKKSEYDLAVDGVVDEIYKYATKYKEYPDIRPSLEELSSRFSVDIEKAYSDVARAFNVLTRK